MPLRGKGRALSGLLRLLNQILNVPFGDHQVLPLKEINGNAGGELGQQNGKHGEHQIIHAAQCPRRPWPGGQHHDERHAAPADDIVAESDGDALGFVLVAHPAELLHGLGDGPVFYAAHVVRPEHLNAVNVLHNAAHRLGADLVFRHAVHLYHPEGQPQVGNQQRDNRQQDQPRRQPDGAYKANQNRGERGVFDNVPTGMGQDFLIAAHIAGHGVHILPNLPLGEAGQGDLLELIPQKQPQALGHRRPADLDLGVPGTVNDQPQQENNSESRGDHSHHSGGNRS